jgi:hypothetical protein
VIVSIGITPNSHPSDWKNFDCIHALYKTPVEVELPNFPFKNQFIYPINKFRIECYLFIIYIVFYSLISYLIYIFLGSRRNQQLNVLKK